MRKIFIGGLVLWLAAMLSQAAFSKVEADLPASVTIEELSKNPQEYLNKNIIIEGILVLEGHWYINPNYYLKKGNYKIAVGMWAPINVIECPPGITPCNRPASMWEYIGKYLVLEGHLEQKESNYIFIVTNAPSKIFCPPDMIVEATGRLTLVTYPAIATDPTHPDPNLVVSYDPPSGSEFPIGTTTVTATATDDLGNESQCSFEVTVVDREPPIISCPTRISVDSLGREPTTGHLIYYVPFRVTDIVTVKDKVDPYPVITTDLPADLFLGTTTVSVWATDASGNTSSCFFEITVMRFCPPVMICPPNMIVEATGKLTQVTYPTIGPIDCNPVINYDPPSGSEFPIGATTVTVTATDDFGNTTVYRFLVTVIPVKGDLNGDGEISPQDALIAFRCYLGIDFCLDDADVNKDGSVTPADALCLFRKYLGQTSDLHQQGTCLL
jgi:hypothetical protein